jgi:hypothetical protein
MRRFGAGCFVWLAVLCVACVGRHARPINVVGAADSQMSCDQLVTERSDLLGREIRLAEAANRVRQRNIYTSVIAVFFYPLWFCLDTRQADYAEWEAVHRRRLHLAEAISMRCD